MIIPQDIFKHILEYCDDRIERRQRKLWASIKTRHYDYILGGIEASDREWEEHQYKDGEKQQDIYVENVGGTHKFSIQEVIGYGLVKIIYNNDNLPSKKGKRNYSPFTLWKSIKIVQKKFIKCNPYVSDMKEMNKILKSEWKLMKGNTEKEKLDIWIASHKNCNYTYKW
jgi:hypothetical protein